MAQDTAKLVSAFKASGLTQKAFCAQRGIAVSVLQYHLRKERTAVENREEHSGTGRFIPLHLNTGGLSQRTVVVLHGGFGTEEIAAVVRSVCR